MPMTDNKNVSHWIEQVKQGDSAAANDLWHHYFDRLVRIVRQRIYGRNRAVSDEEDVVVSVFESFYRAAEKGRFPDLADRDDLWKLLLRMASRKVIDNRRHAKRQRRGGEVETFSLDQSQGESESEQRMLAEAIGDEPTPEMALCLQESVEKLFSHLGGGQLQELAVAKLEGYTNAELAKRFQCSERTIERRLHLIREKCRQELTDESTSTTTDLRPRTD
ncbi:MAG: sigma-70 family RNA polymerase sigma factor [Pirellulaceae bacterium]